MAADCDTDHYFVVKNLGRDWQSKQTRQRFHMGSFNLKQLNEIDRKEQYRVEISNRFAALENLHRDGY
jgi:hypothetical protein